MKQIESVVVAFDGESKCGKTTIIKAVAERAGVQATIIPAIQTHAQQGLYDLGSFTEGTVEKLGFLQEAYGFTHIQTISCGNAFRAATLYKAIREMKGERVEGFTQQDIDPVRALLKSEGIIDILQEDPNIAEQVSVVGNMPGAQNLGGTLFCDSVRRAYFKDGGANLVVVDARDPIGHMWRNQLAGQRSDQIHPSAILPVYIDTSAEASARRIEGDYEVNYRKVLERRSEDRNHHENPVVRPTEFEKTLNGWAHQALLASSTSGETVKPYLFDNNIDDPDSLRIKGFANEIAVVAQDVAIYRHTARAEAAGRA